MFSIRVASSSCCGCCITRTEQCRRRSVINTAAHRSHSDVTVTSSRADDVIYHDATGDDLERSGSGDDDAGSGPGSGQWTGDAFSMLPVTGRWIDRPSRLMLSIDAFRPAAEDVDVAVATQRPAAAATSSSTSRRHQSMMTSFVTSFLLAQLLALTVLQTPHRISFQLLVL